MKRQFDMSDELKEYLSGVPSSRLINVVWDVTADPDNNIPTNPNTVRRHLIFDKTVLSMDATPVDQYAVFTVNLDLSNDAQVLEPRAL